MDELWKGTLSLAMQLRKDQNRVYTAEGVQSDFECGFIGGNSTDRSPGSYVPRQRGVIKDYEDAVRWMWRTKKVLSEYVEGWWIEEGCWRRVND
jgi:hypothetical protein